MSKPFTIKNKPLHTSKYPRRHLIQALVFILLPGLMIMAILALGRRSGESCDRTHATCVYAHYCVDQICKPECQLDADCPDSIKCILIEREGIFSLNSFKVCDLPSPLEQSGERSLTRSLQNLDDALYLSRKKTEVFQWLMIELTPVGRKLSNQQFDALWVAIGEDQCRQLKVSQLGQIILTQLRESSPHFEPIK